MIYNDLVAAIDIGTTKIVAIIGRKDSNGKFEILGLGKTLSRGVRRGVVNHIEDTTQAIIHAVENVENATEHQFAEVFVGIAGQHIKSVKNRAYKYIDADEISSEDVLYLFNQMQKMPVDPGEEIIHVIPQGYIVDEERDVVNPVGMSGRKLESNYHIVIGKLAAAKNINKCIEKADLYMLSLLLEPIASAEAVLTKDEKEGGVVLVDIGGGTTDVAVYYENVIRHTAVIPFGGNVITGDIKEGCSLLQRQAEALKIKHGSAVGDIAPKEKFITIPGISGRESKEISYKNLAYIIQARMEEIIDAVHFEVESSGFAEKLSAGYVLTGGGSLLKHLPQLVKFRTGCDVRLGVPTEQLTPDINPEIRNPMYSTAIGLLLKGQEMIENGTIKPGKKRRHKTSGPVNLNLGLISDLKRVLVNFFDNKDNELS